MKQPPAVTILTGELDLHASRTLGQRLSAEVGAGVAAADVILDLSAVSFIDSSALGVIVQADQRLGRQGRALAGVAPRGTGAAGLGGMTPAHPRLRGAPTRRGAEAPPPPQGEPASP